MSGNSNSEGVLKQKKAAPRAGAIVVRNQTGETQVLIAQSAKNDGCWVFPKGRIDRGETAQQAAIREVEEETGVIIRIAGDLDRLEYKSEDGPVLVDFFLAVATGEGKQVDEREIRWCSLDEASALLSFDEAAEMLRRAVPFIVALGSGVEGQ